MAGDGCMAAQPYSAYDMWEEDYSPPKKPQKKKKSKKHKKPKKHKKHTTKKHKRNEKIYSEHNIEKILKNDQEDPICNRLNCSSNLKIAKSCLKTKEAHREKKNCFRAFCAYGCNDLDYTTKPEVYDFCNETCSSKKYLRNKKRPE
jgi:hypothetical protein